jgi:L-fuculose-phosphate aldolase
MQCNASMMLLQIYMTKVTQYTKESITTFEETFGANYMSAGGEAMTVKTADALKSVLTKQGGARILDVGFGIGGPAFYFAETFGAHVHGVDVNPVGVDMAQKEAVRRASKVGSTKFEVLDIGKAHFAPASYDIIHSRDVMVHLSSAAKDQLFVKFREWLSPGGMVCIGDYCLGTNSTAAGEPSPVMQKYLDARGYHMMTPVEYAQRFVQAGFEPDYTEAQDLALWYCSVCQTEIDRVSLPGPNRDKFLEQHGEKALLGLQKTYSDKIQMTLRGDRSYVMVTATNLPAEHILRKEVCNAYKQLSKVGQIMSCDGNVSARASKDTFLITPSGVNIPDLSPDKMVLCTNDGKACKGEAYKPSSESNLHNLIYQNRPDVGGIVHAHSIYVCALACCRIPLPPAHYAVCELLQEVTDFSSSTGGSTVKNIDDMVVKCAPYHTYGTKELGKATLDGLGKNHAVLMANHGAVVVGADMECAMYNAERLERECEIYWRCLQMGSVGPPKPLTLSDIQALQSADETYGQDHREEEVEDAETSKENQMTVPALQESLADTKL